MHKFLKLSSPLIQSLRFGLLLVLLLGWCTNGVSRADTIQYNVSFNNPNAFLFDAASGPYALDFFLSAGSNTTSVSGSNFSGSGTGAANNFTLNNTAGEAETTSAFTPPTTSPAPSGSLLSFDITANYTPGSLDTFSFGVYKSFGTDNQGLIVTNEPGLAQSFFTIDFSNLNGPTVGSYSSNDAGFNIGAPTITRVSATATPEPETWAMMALGLGAMALLGCKPKKIKVVQAV